MSVSLRVIAACGVMGDGRAYAGRADHEGFGFPARIESIGGDANHHPHPPVIGGKSATVAASVMEV
jgi:hypothetical protein